MNYNAVQTMCKAKDEAEVRIQGIHIVPLPRGSGQEGDAEELESEDVAFAVEFNDNRMPVIPGQGALTNAYPHLVRPW